MVISITIKSEDTNASPVSIYWLQFAEFMPREATAKHASHNMRSDMKLGQTLVDELRPTGGPKGGDNGWPSGTCPQPYWHQSCSEASILQALVFVFDQMERERETRLCRLAPARRPSIRRLVNKAGATSIRRKTQSIFVRNTIFIRYSYKSD